MGITLISKSTPLREYLPAFLLQFSLIFAKFLYLENLFLECHSTSHSMLLAT